MIQFWVEGYNLTLGRMVWIDLGSKVWSYCGEGGKKNVGGPTDRLIDDTFKHN